MTTEQDISQTIKNYKKTGIQKLRPYIDGEDMTDILVRVEDDELDTLVGGMIAVSDDSDDKRYVSKVFFDTNYAVCRTVSQQRVIDDRSALRMKRDSLAKFMTTSEFMVVGTAEQSRLRDQLQVMGMYISILGARIEAF